MRVARRRLRGVCHRDPGAVPARSAAAGAGQPPAEWRRALRVYHPLPDFPAGRRRGGGATVIADCGARRWRGSGSAPRERAVGIRGWRDTHRPASSSPRQTSVSRSASLSRRMHALTPRPHSNHSNQAVSSAPFRVVDEINQGMDPDNERRVHTQLVAAASKCARVLLMERSHSIRCRLEKRRVWSWPDRRRIRGACHSMIAVPRSPETHCRHLQAGHAAVFPPDPQAPAKPALQRGRVRPANPERWVLPECRCANLLPAGKASVSGVGGFWGGIG